MMRNVIQFFRFMQSSTLAEKTAWDVIGVRYIQSYDNPTGDAYKDCQIVKGKYSNLWRHHGWK